MAIELKIPELGENIPGGQVVGLRTKVGQHLAKDAPVLELEAGKAVVEIPAAAAGTVEQLLVAVGDEVKVGQAFLRLAEDEASAPEAAKPDQQAAESAAEKAKGGEAAESAKKTAKSAAGGAKGATDVAESAAEKAKDGDVAESATKDDEASAESISPAELPPEPAPRAAAPAAAERPHLPPAGGDEAAVGQSASPAGVVGQLVPAAPSVRRFARELGVEIDTVRGSGPHGRVSVEDVKRHVRDRQEHHLPGAPGLPLPELPDFSRWGSVRREKMSAVRFATAEQVTRCWTNIPRVTHFDQADITKLEGLRRKYADRAAGSGGKLTMAVMVVKAVALALRKFPAFNASLDLATREIVYKDYIHIGIAVATPRGLLVPVVRDADKKNMVQLAGEIGSLAGKCRDGKVKPEDLQGGSFTVTNLGSIGGSHFTPIVNFPEVAILGMGRSAEQLMLVDGQVEARTMLPLSLSYDHRLIDGADAAHFVRWLAEAIEEPLLLSLEG